MDFWGRTARKSRKEKIRNLKIREIMNVHHNITEHKNRNNSGEIDKRITVRRKITGILN